jgi:hypothetical protein
MFQEVGDILIISLWAESSPPLSLPLHYSHEFPQKDSKFPLKYHLMVEANPLHASLGYGDFCFLSLWGNSEFRAYV